MAVKVKQVRRAYSGRVIDVDVETVCLPNGHECDMEIIQHPGGSAVVVIDGAQRVCLLHQYRHVAGQWLWELPAGKIDHQEDPLQTARRELAEEAGILAQQWSSLGTIYSSPGVFREVIHLYLARDIRSTQMQHEPAEVIEVQWLALKEALDWAKSGQILDAKTVIGLFRAAAVLDPDQ